VNFEQPVTRAREAKRSLTAVRRGRANPLLRRVLAESRQSCSRRTTFLRFAAKGVEPDLVALPVGLRFYVSRGVARPSRRNSGTLSRDGDRAEELNGGRETRKKRLHKPFTRFHRCLYKQQRNPRHEFGEVWSNSSSTGTCEGGVRARRHAIAVQAARAEQLLARSSDDWRAPAPASHGAGLSAAAQIAQSGGAGAPRMGLRLAGRGGIDRSAPVRATRCGCRAAAGAPALGQARGGCRCRRRS